MALAEALGVSCSRRAELLVAFTYAVAPERMVAVAQRVGADSGVAAAQLATTLAELSPDYARGLVQRLLESRGFSSLGALLPPAGCRMADRGRQPGE